MGTRTDAGVEVVSLTHDDAMAMFDRVVRENMDMSGAEFLRRWDEHEYEDIDFDSVPGLVEVWMYLPFVR